MDDVLWEKLCAALCHDMASPLGAMGLAQDLVWDDPQGVQDILRLSYDTLQKQLRFFRALCGSKKDPTAPSFKELKEITCSSLYKIHIQFLCPLPDDGSLNRMLLALLMFLSKASLKNCSVSLTLSGEPIVSWEGESLNPIRFLDLATHHTSDLDPGDIYVLWACAFGRKHGKEIVIDPTIRGSHLIIRNTSLKSLAREREDF